MKYLSLSINGTPMAAPTGVPGGGVGTLNQILGVGLAMIFVFAALFAIYTSVRGGIQWSMSGGDKAKIEQARLRIIYGILGFVLVLFSFLIVNFVYGFFGLNSF